MFSEKTKHSFPTTKQWKSAALKLNANLFSNERNKVKIENRLKNIIIITFRKSVFLGLHILV